MNDILASSLSQQSAHILMRLMTILRDFFAPKSDIQKHLAPERTVSEKSVNNTAKVLCAGLAVALSASGCASVDNYEKETLTVSTRSFEKLPALETAFIKTPAALATTTAANAAANTIVTANANANITTENTTPTTRVPFAVKDTAETSKFAALFEEEAKKNLLSLTHANASLGYLVCAQKSRHTVRYLPLAFVSGFFCLIPNVFGMPLGGYDFDADVTLQVWDKNGNVLGEYRAHGNDFQWIAFYYGYREGEDFFNAGKLRAFKTGSTPPLKNSTPTARIFVKISPLRKQHTRHHRHKMMASIILTRHEYILSDILYL
ncbi:MAG: hypothetical protein LBD14_03390 [Puniceicoccales bacterium]|jgi:hypothetical protein|nr:hypothetical protein [Puniceicoccales bacterium]